MSYFVINIDGDKNPNEKNRREFIAIDVDSSVVYFWFRFGSGHGKGFVANHQRALNSAS